MEEPPRLFEDMEASPTADGQQVRRPQRCTSPLDCSGIAADRPDRCTTSCSLCLVLQESGSHTFSEGTPPIDWGHEANQAEKR